jgi:hypothetical protein
VTTTDGSTDGSDEQPGLSRRAALKRLGVAAGVAWSTPVVMSFFTPASAAVGTPSPTTTSTTVVPVECIGGICGELIECSSENPDCVCVSTVDGGLCIPGATECFGLPLCPDGVCPAGSTCASDTCCGDPVCIPLDVADACRPAAFGFSGRGGTRVSTGPGTVGG